MNYCGVEYTAVQAAGRSSWKWRFVISSKAKLKISGEAESREKAIKQARDAIGKALRAQTKRQRMQME